MTDRNALIGSILAAAAIVVTGFGVGCYHDYARQCRRKDVQECVRSR